MALAGAACDYTNLLCLCSSSFPLWTKNEALGQSCECFYSQRNIQTVWRFFYFVHKNPTLFGWGFLSDFFCFMLTLMFSLNSEGTPTNKGWPQIKKEPWDQPKLEYQKNQSCCSLFSIGKNKEGKLHKSFMFLWWKIKHLKTKNQYLHFSTKTKISCFIFLNSLTKKKTIEFGTHINSSSYKLFPSHPFQKCCQKLQIRFFLQMKMKMKIEIGDLPFIKAPN